MLQEMGFNKRSSKDYTKHYANGYLKIVVYDLEIEDEETETKHTETFWDVGIGEYATFHDVVISSDEIKTLEQLNEIKQGVEDLHNDLFNIQRHLQN